jgi:uncharacterized membrane protein YhaH (DUF805 family)
MIDKQTRAVIEDKLKSGLPKKDIFIGLGKTGDVATALADTPYYSDRQKYFRLNSVLVSILVYIAVYRIIISLVVILFSEVPAYLFPLALIYPVLFFLVAVTVRRFRGHELACALCLLFLGQSLSAKWNGAGPVMLALYMFLKED